MRLFSLFVLLVAAGCGQATGTSSATDADARTTSGTATTKTGPAASQDNTIRVTSSQLYSEYKDNRFTADRKYKGKVIEVTGVVMDNAAPTFPDKHRVQLGNPFRGVQVSCDFDVADASKALSLESSKEATVRGKVVGLDVTVDLEDCEIVK